jgi:uncharacterized protein (TIGR04255 family)
MASARFNINPNERFEHLPAAPIVEAVIQWRARAGRPLEPNDLLAKLGEYLPDYPLREPQHLLEFALQGTVGEDQPVPAATHRAGWHGFRVSTADDKYIAQFTQNGLVFSRMQPYEDWERFSTEGLRLWSIFKDIAGPLEIQRLGVRFVNRITGATFETLNEFLKEPPTCPSSLPLSGFLYQSTFDVPGHPFGIRVVKTMQPGILAGLPDSGLILDIDVVTSRPLSCEDQVLDDVLPKMRWLKNRIFFDLLTPEAIEKFKGA